MCGWREVTAAGLVRGVVVEEAEEGGEFAGWEAWEERHGSLGWVLRYSDDSVGLLRASVDAEGLHKSVWWLFVVLFCSVLMMIVDEAGADSVYILAKSRMQKILELARCCWLSLLSIRLFIAAYADEDAISSHLLTRFRNVYQDMVA